MTEQELMTRAAWLYYVAGMNQEATSLRLGLTRARVNRLLQQSREAGIVSISVNERDLGLLKVEETLRARFGLEECIATAPLELETTGAARGKALDQKAVLRLVGAAGAGLLRDRLATDPDAIVGTGWGRTLAALAKALSRVTAPEARFVSLMGSLTSNSAFNPFDVVQTLAQSTGGEGFFIPVPFIVDSAKDRALLLSQRAVLAPLALAHKADLAFISVGELTEDSLLFRQKMITEEELVELRKLGAVGDTNGIFFDAEGRPVDHSLNWRSIAVGLDELRGTHTVLLSAGESKLAATEALLKSGTISGLVIDGDSAIRLAASRTVALGAANRATGRAGAL